MATSPTILTIALATPLRRSFDYLPHEGSDANWQPGLRVSVPFGKQTRTGIILAVSKHSAVAAHKLKRIHHVIDHEPILPTSLLKLMHWASDYYHHPLGDSLFTALPTRLREGKDPFPAPITPKNPYTTPQFVATHTPNAEQAHAIATLSQATGFSVTLLEGVTGSGKTLVYLHCIASVIARGLQALVLVPEIGLTPQTVQRFEQHFQCKIAAIHSGLTPKKRADAWLAARQGLARIIIGTRSALFTPLQAPGIIIIDEEHDASFKQQEGFRYSARDLAVVRAQYEAIPLVLGSATPSCETMHNVTRQRYQHLTLTARAGQANPPKVTLLDIRAQSLQEGLAPALLHTIEAHLRAKGQVLLFVNRRGFAPTLICHECGWVAGCQHCDARLTLHQHNRTLNCHHCARTYPVVHCCLQCQSPALLPQGIGTQRLEALLTQRYPEVKTARIDRDSISRKGELEQALDAFARHQTDILIGTQMLAKGHDFKDLTLVAIIDSDSGLYSSDFRAIERMGQLITQVAGRAGRALRAGEVIVQTRNPDNPLLQQLMHAPYGDFLQTILHQRQQGALPPFHHFAMLRADARKPGVALTFLNQIKARLQSTGESLDCLGPIPAFMERRADRFRAQLLICTPQRQQLKARLTPLITWLSSYKHGLGASLRWSVDVDPNEMF